MSFIRMIIEENYMSIGYMYLNINYMYKYKWLVVYLMCLRYEELSLISFNRMVIVE